MPFDENLRHGIRSRRPDQVELTRPDPTWPAQGARIVARIAAATAGLGVRVEHVGSTSVARLPARGVIDVQVGVRRLADADRPAFGAAMRAAGYLLAPGYTADRPPSAAPGSGWEKRFYGGADPGRVVHVHVRETGSAGHDFALAFRDWLRAVPAERDGYAAEKARLAPAAPACPRLRGEPSGSGSTRHTGAWWPGPARWTGGPDRTPSSKAAGAPRSGRLSAASWPIRRFTG